LNIITTCPKCWEDTGAYKYLKNLELIESIQSRSTHIPWEELKTVDADLIITCGIGEIDLLKLSTRFLNNKEVKVGVLFCSPLAQAHVVPSSQNGDLDSLLRYVNMLKSGDIDYLFVASCQLETLFQNEKIIYLPAPLHLSGYQISKERKGIGFFGTMDKHKNLATMFGAIKYSKILDPLIITGSEKISMCNFFSNLFDMKNIIVYPRLPKHSLLDMMSKVKLGIQIGFSESFNYTTWELAMLEVPSVVGPSIWWYASDKELKEYCVVSNLDDPILIGEKIRDIYFGSDIFYKHLCSLVKEVAEKTALENNQMIPEILKKLC
jgi:hypothetical protein